jgi:hypothetical protein
MPKRALGNLKKRRPHIRRQVMNFVKTATSHIGKMKAELTLIALILVIGSTA